MLKFFPLRFYWLPVWLSVAFASARAAITRASFVVEDGKPGLQSA
ncbi:MAG: hypothetical protein WD872_10615 [Pirellulaceae bacterium]